MTKGQFVAIEDVSQKQKALFFSFDDRKIGKGKSKNTLKSKF